MAKNIEIGGNLKVVIIAIIVVIFLLQVLKLIFF